MSCSPLERLIKHNFRLGLLCCLIDGPLAIPQLSARLDKPVPAVAYHVKLLETRDVVEQTGEGESDEALYVATLDQHPVWVEEAVREHQKEEEAG